MINDCKMLRNDSLRCPDWRLLAIHFVPEDVSHSEQVGVFNTSRVLNHSSICLSFHGEEEKKVEIEWAETGERRRGNFKTKPLEMSRSVLTGKQSYAENARGPLVSPYESAKGIKVGKERHGARDGQGIWSTAATTSAENIWVIETTAMISDDTFELPLQVFVS